MIRRTRTDARHRLTRENTLDEAAFDVVTPESAYWVGFLMAAGSITRAGTRSPAIAVTTADEDRTHLERFRAFVRAMDPITVGTRDGFRDASRSYLSVQVRSGRLAKTLARYGVVPYKTLVARAFELENDPHFWRGCIDGGGSIAVSRDEGVRRPVISFACRSRELAGQFADFARETIPGCDIQEETRTPRAYCVTHTVVLRGADCVRMARALYGDGYAALPRKLAAAQEILREFGDDSVAPGKEAVACIGEATRWTPPLSARPGTLQPRLF